MMRAVLYFLGCLTEMDIKWLVSNGRAVPYDQGDVLITAGEPITDIGFLMEGELSIVLDSQSGKEVNRMYAGEIFGEISFLDSRPPSATVNAVTGVQILAIDREDMEAKLRRDPEFAARFFRGIGVLMANRLRGLIDHLDDADEGNRFSEEFSEELDPELLDLVNLAGRRFDLMVELFRERSTTV